jgi:hypothetical protein
MLQTSEALWAASGRQSLLSSGSKGVAAAAALAGALAA